MRFVLLLALFSTTALADVEGTTFRAPKWNVQMVVPRGWVLTDQSTFPDLNYPGILVVGTKGQAVISLAAQTIDPAESVKAYAQRNVDALKKLDPPFTVTVPTPHGAGVLLVDAGIGVKRLRQAYLTHGSSAYILTLAFPATIKQSEMTDLLHEFDVTLRGLTFTSDKP